MTDVTKPESENLEPERSDEPWGRSGNEGLNAQLRILLFQDWPLVLCSFCCWIALLQLCPCRKCDGRTLVFRVLGG